MNLAYFFECLEHEHTMYNQALMILDLVMEEWRVMIASVLVEFGN